MRLWWGALLCWAGFHAPRYDMVSYGLQARCRRCGLWLREVR